MDQLRTIFRALGTPTEEDWPGYTKLPDYVTVGQFARTPLRDLFTAATPEALNLLGKCLIYEPRRRISARDVSTFRYPVYVTTNISLPRHSTTHTLLHFLTPATLPNSPDQLPPRRQGPSMMWMVTSISKAPQDQPSERLILIDSSGRSSHLEALLLHALWPESWTSRLWLRIRPLSLSVNSAQIASHPLSVHTLGTPYRLKGMYDVTAH